MAFEVGHANGGPWLCRASLAIAFGVAAFFWPGAFLVVAAVVTFAVYSLVYGILAIAGAVTGRGSRRGPRWAPAAAGARWQPRRRR